VRSAVEELAPQFESKTATSSHHLRDRQRAEAADRGREPFDLAIMTAAVTTT